MYNDHYGLTGRPFQLTPDPRFYFESATHKKAMAYLGYGLAQGEGFIVVTGEIGSGKTTLVGHLMESVDRNRVNAVKIVSTQVEGDDMLRMVANALGVPTDNAEKAQLLDRIERQINDRARAGQRTLLIIDEVQNLPFSGLEELRMLSNYQSGGQSMLQIFLLGQPEFRDRLETSDRLEQLRQRVIATHHLTAMEANEVGPYILHRMKLVGWTGTPTLADDAFASLYRHSGGIPRKINTLMTRVLLMGALEKSAVIDSGLVEAVLDDLAADHAGDGATDASGLKLVQTTGFKGDDATLDLAARVAVLETQSLEQGEALRRVIAMLADWVEAEEALHSETEIRRAPAA
ncbi:MAG: XrtA/PEP-CTERM system-associated ATPase [Pseudomonadota bacterium]